MNLFHDLFGYELDAETQLRQKPALGLNSGMRQGGKFSMTNM
jgi:hypothetical protein